MFKSKLQELCQRKEWSLPIYCQAQAPTGPAHNPRFKAKVKVKEIEYNSPGECKSSKEAQNQAARIALEALTTPDQALHAINIPGPATVAGDASSHFYKNQLLNYTQQKKQGVPTYEVNKFGPKHSRRFKARVSIDEKRFDHPGYFSTKKAAQHAAAKNALRSLSMQPDVCKDPGYLSPRDKRAASRDQKRNEGTKL